MCLNVLCIHEEGGAGRPFVDLGSGSGVVCVLVSAMSTGGRRVLGVERDLERHTYAAAWGDACRASLEGLVATRTRCRFVPQFVHADFVTDDVRGLRCVVSASTPSIIFCNNASDRMAGDSTQEKMEDMLMSCCVGTIVVFMAQSFRGHRRGSWYEEIIATTAEGPDQSWTDLSGDKEIKFYRYTKRDDVIVNRRTSLRVRADKETTIPFRKTMHLQFE